MAHATADEDSDSTLSSLGTDPRRRSAAIVARGIASALLVVVVLTAATGLLGVHSRTMSATANGFTLTVEYAGVARAGLDVPFRVRVTSAAPWGEDITVSVNRTYFTLFETQGFHPEPSDEAAQGDDILLTFAAPPAGGPFTADYDAYIQPSSQIGTAGHVAVVVDDKPVVAVDFVTFLFP